MKKKKKQRLRLTDILKHSTALMEAYTEKPSKEEVNTLTHCKHIVSHIQTCKTLWTAVFRYT